MCPVHEDIYQFLKNMVIVINVTDVSVVSVFIFIIIVIMVTNVTFAAMFTKVTNVYWLHCSRERARSVLLRRHFRSPFLILGILSNCPS